MEKVRPRCGQPSDRAQLKNRTEQMSQMHAKIVAKCRLVQKIEEWKLTVGRTRPIAPPASLTRCDIGLYTVVGAQLARGSEADAYIR